MAGYWNPTTVNWYERAISWSGYPLNVIGAQISNLIRAGDRVIDAGSGIGAVSLAVARSCADVIKVTAVDSQQEALAFLMKRALAEGLANIEARAGNWEDVELEPADVTICAYAVPISRSPAGLAKLARLTKRAGLLLTPRVPMQRASSLGRLARALGLDTHDSCENGCREAGMLQALGHEVECEAIVHDLSQPVSGIDDAWGFFRSIMRAPADVEQEARSLLERYLKCRDGITYLTIIRKSCLIRFAPKSAVNKE